MPSSGTYAFSMDHGDFVEEAFERCGVDPATLVSRHFGSALRSCNLLFSHWATKGVRTFQVDEQTQIVTQGLAAYSVAAGTLGMLGGFIRRSGIDTPVQRITLDQWEAIVDKAQQGLPNQVWADRRAGQYTLWQVPENSTDVFHYLRSRQIQDATSGLETPDVPYYWYEALASGLAEFLSIKYSPDRYGLLKGIAGERFADARAEDRERADTSFDIGVR